MTPSKISHMNFKTVPNTAVFANIGQIKFSRVHYGAD